MRLHGRRRLSVCMAAAAVLLAVGGILALLLLLDSPFDLGDGAAASSDSQAGDVASDGNPTASQTTQHPERTHNDDATSREPASPQDATAGAPDDQPGPDAAQQEVAEDDDAWHGAALSGRVVTPHAAPLAGAQVALVGPDNLQRLGRRGNRTYQPPLTMPAGLTTVTSDDDGRFVLPLRERFAGRAWLIVVAEAPHAAALDDLGRNAYLSRPASQLALAQAPLDRGDIVVPLGASVEGRVTDESTGEPVPGAHILAGGYREQVEAEPHSYRTRRGAVETETDEDGRYRVTGVLPEQRIFVRVEAEGYVHRQRQIELEPGEARSGFDFELLPAPALQVRVSDEHGTPMSGVRIELSGENMRETDAAGEALFAQFPMLTVDVRAHKLGYRAQGRQTTRLRLVPNQTITHEITMLPAALVSLRPVDATHETPLFGDEHAPLDASALTTRVYGETDRGPRWRRTPYTVDADGTVYMHRRDFSNITQLEVWPHGYERKDWELSLGEGESRELGDVAFERGTRVLVEIHDPTGEPLSNLHVEARLLARGTDDNRYRLRASFAARSGYTDEQGHWTTPVLHGESVQLRIRQSIPDDDGQASWIRVATHEVALDTAEELLHVILTVDPRAGYVSVRGTAYGLDGVPLAGQPIHLVHENGRRTTTTCDEHGRFQLVTRRQGRFRLTTRPHRQFFDEHGFVLRRGDHIERDFHQSEDLVRARLLWHDGAPASGLLVSFQWGDFQALPRHWLDRTDGQGRFNLLERRGGRRSQAESPLTLRVEVEPGRVLHARLDVEGSAELGEFRLPPIDETTRGALTVRIVEAHTDRPISGRVDLFGEVDGERVWRRDHVTGEARFEDLPAGRLRITVRSGEHLRLRRTVELTAGETTEATFEVDRRVDAHFHVLLADQGIAGAGQARIRVHVTEVGNQEADDGQTEAGNHGATLRIRHLQDRRTYEATITCRGYHPQTIRFEAQAGSGGPMQFNTTLYPEVQD